MRRLFPLVIFIFVFPLFIFSQSLKGIDEIAPFSEGLAAVRKGNQWGFINEEGNLLIDFRGDLVWNKNADTSKSGVASIRYPLFKDGRCMIKKLDDEIAVFGFMDKTGTIVIEPQFLNVSNFDQGYTTGVFYEKVFKGVNEFKLRIYDFKFHDVMMDTSGQIVEFFTKRINIQMTKKRYELPRIGTKIISANLIAIRTDDNLVEIRKLSL